MFESVGLWAKGVFVQEPFLTPLFLSAVLWAGLSAVVVAEWRTPHSSFYYLTIVKKRFIPPVEDAAARCLVEPGTLRVFNWGEMLALWNAQPI